MLDAEIHDIVLKKLSVHFAAFSGLIRAVDGVDAVFSKGHITGILGESGCGKSVLGLGILGLLPSYARVGGEILYGDTNMLKADPRWLRIFRGRGIGLIPQNPSESLNSARRIGAHLDEAMLNLSGSGRERKARAEALLRSFGFEEPSRIMRAYPFELSGGMQQRVLCAIGVACSPQWVLADEPTKGLDFDLRGQVCDTLLSLRQHGVGGMLVITHDLALAENVCDTVAIMYGGEILETGRETIRNPRHPYTKDFLEALPKNGMRPIPGMPPEIGDKTAGCKYAPRCKYRKNCCDYEKPPSVETEGSTVRCFLYA